MAKRTVKGKVYWWTPERMQIDVYIDGVFSREFSYDGDVSSRMMESISRINRQTHILKV